MGKLYIHPGYGKTATTAIQNIGLSFDANCPCSFCMCPYGIVGDANNLFSHNHPLFDSFKYDQDLIASLEFIKSRSGVTLISSEFLIRQEPSKTINFVKEFLLNGIDVFVLVGIRNYPDLLLSSYLQALKVNYGMLPCETLEEYIEREICQIRITDLLSPWSNVVGKSNVILIDYDRNPVNFVNRFFLEMGVNLDQCSKSVMNFNPSLPIEAIPLINCFDQISLDQKARQEIINIVMGMQYIKYDENAYIDIAKKKVGELYSNDINIISKLYEVK